MFPPRLKVLGKMTRPSKDSSWCVGGKNSPILPNLLVFALCVIVVYKRPLHLSPSLTLGSQVWSDDSADDVGDSDDGYQTGIGDIIEIDC